MRNWIRTAVISAVMAWSGGAAALDGTGGTMTQLGTCNVETEDYNTLSLGLVPFRLIEVFEILISESSFRSQYVDFRLRPASRAAA